MASTRLSLEASIIHGMQICYRAAHGAPAYRPWIQGKDIRLEQEQEEEEEERWRIVERHARALDCLDRTAVVVNNDTTTTTLKIRHPIQYLLNHCTERARIIPLAAHESEEADAVRRFIAMPGTAIARFLVAKKKPLLRRRLQQSGAWKTIVAENRTIHEEIRRARMPAQLEIDWVDLLILFHAQQSLVMALLRAVSENWPVLLTLILTSIQDASQFDRLVNEPETYRAASIASTDNQRIDLDLFVTADDESDALKRVRRSVRLRRLLVAMDSRLPNRLLTPLELAAYLGHLNTLHVLLADSRVNVRCLGGSAVILAIVGAAAAGTTSAFQLPPAVGVLRRKEELQHHQVSVLQALIVLEQRTLLQNMLRSRTWSVDALNQWMAADPLLVIDTSPEMLETVLDALPSNEWQIARLLVASIEADAFDAFQVILRFMRQPLPRVVDIALTTRPPSELRRFLAIFTATGIQQPLLFNNNDDDDEEEEEEAIPIHLMIDDALVALFTEIPFSAIAQFVRTSRALFERMRRWTRWLEVVNRHDDIFVLRDPLRIAFKDGTARDVLNREEGPNRLPGEIDGRLWVDMMWEFSRARQAANFTRQLSSLLRRAAENNWITHLRLLALSPEIWSFSVNPGEVYGSPGGGTMFGVAMLHGHVDTARFLLANMRNPDIALERSMEKFPGAFEDPERVMALFLGGIEGEDRLIPEVFSARWVLLHTVVRSARQASQRVRWASAFMDPPFTDKEIAQLFSLDKPYDNVSRRGTETATRVPAYTHSFLQRVLDEAPATYTPSTSHELDEILLRIDILGMLEYLPVLEFAYEQTSVLVTSDIDAASFQIEQLDDAISLDDAIRQHRSLRHFSGDFNALMRLARRYDTLLERMRDEIISHRADYVEETESGKRLLTLDNRVPVDQMITIRPETQVLVLITVISLTGPGRRIRWFRVFTDAALTRRLESEELGANWGNMWSKQENRFGLDFRRLRRIFQDRISPDGYVDFFLVGTTERNQALETVRIRVFV